MQPQQASTTASATGYKVQLSPRLAALYARVPERDRKAADKLVEQYGQALHVLYETERVMRQSSDGLLGRLWRRKRY